MSLFAQAARSGAMACLAALFCGCKAHNARLPALSSLDAHARFDAAPIDEVATTTLDRSWWEMPAVTSPIDSVHGFPAYANAFRKTHATTRQRGEFPTATTALELTGDTGKGQRREALLSPFYAGADIVLMPVRMILRSPDTEVRHVPADYDRLPVGQ